MNAYNDSFMGRYDFSKVADQRKAAFKRLRDAIKLLDANNDIDWIGRADEFPVNHPQSTVRLAKLYADHGHLEEAEIWYAKAVEHPEGSTWGWLWCDRGANFASLNQFQAAESCYRRVLTIPDADSDEAWLNLGSLLCATGRYQEAIAAFQTALEITPDYKAASDQLQSLSDIFGAVSLARRTPPMKVAGAE